MAESWRGQAADAISSRTEVQSMSRKTEYHYPGGLKVVRRDFVDKAGRPQKTIRQWRKDPNGWVAKRPKG